MPVCPPAERMPSASTLPATAVTSWMAASLTPKPRPPVQDWLIDWLIVFCRSSPWLAGSWAVEPADDPAATPNLSEVFAPSMVIWADSSEPR
jgi:hypothetical protein